MKHEITTLNTKRALAASLKKFIAKKPMSKITISEIIADCGVNRKTFYYHFDDIYALLKWMFAQEAIEVVKQFNLIVEYEEAIIFVMDYVDQNEHILNCVYNSIGRDELKRFFYADFIGITRSIIDKAEEMENISAPEDYKEFLSRFYTEAIAGILLDWIQYRSTRNREKTIKYISMTLRESIPNVLNSAAGSMQNDLLVK